MPKNTDLAYTVIFIRQSKKNMPDLNFSKRFLLSLLRNHVEIPGSPFSDADSPAVPEA